MTRMNLSQEQTHRHRGQTGDFQGGTGGRVEWEAGVSRDELFI